MNEISVSDVEPQVFIVGQAPNQRRIAFRRRAPVRSGAPGVVWLCGYRSDMDSTKATALDAEAGRLGLGVLRFDYSGHGRSDGRLEDGTISCWLEETLALLRAESQGPQILVGSSMGGWLALLAARALGETGEMERLKGLILIAPAVDFTEALVWAQAPEEARRAIMDEGAWRRPSAYSSEPDCLTRDLIEDGRKHLMLGAMIRTRAPTVVLQGMRDEDVPYSHALKLMQRFGDPATLTLVKDGDHRLSRPQDLQLMCDALEGWPGKRLAPSPETSRSSSERSAENRHCLDGPAIRLLQFFRIPMASQPEPPRVGLSRIERNEMGLKPLKINNSAEWPIRRPQ